TDPSSQAKTRMRRSLPLSYRPPNAVERSAANIRNMRTDPRGSKTPLGPDTIRRGTYPGRSRRNRPPSIAEGWVEMPWSIRILRAFLGITFVFAGVQKFLDPNFFRAGGGDYIGTQLAGFAAGGRPSGRSVGWPDPRVRPSVLLRLAHGRVVADSGACTHEGGLVGYDPSSHMLVCPCHGAEFDAGHQAAAIARAARTRRGSI